MLSVISYFQAHLSNRLKLIHWAIDLMQRSFWKIRPNVQEHLVEKLVC